MERDGAGKGIKERVMERWINIMEGREGGNDGRWKNGEKAEMEGKELVEERDATRKELCNVKRR